MTAPTVRVDREWGEDSELFVVEHILRRVAGLINAKTLAGPIYGRILLPPEQAARKKALMEQGGQ